MSEKTYALEDLSPEARDHALSLFEYPNDGWSDYVTEGWESALGCAGFGPVGIAWSGFSSQGDGASFAGNWRMHQMDLVKLMTDNPVALNRVVNKQFRTFLLAFTRARLTDENVGLSRMHSRYAHSGTMQTSFGRHLLEDEVPEGMGEEEFAQRVSDVETTFLEWARGVADAIYKDLEATWDYEVSDDAVQDRAECYMFTEDGDLA